MNAQWQQRLVWMNEWRNKLSRRGDLMNEKKTASTEAAWWMKEYSSGGDLMNARKYQWWRLDEWKNTAAVATSWMKENSGGGSEIICWVQLSKYSGGGNEIIRWILLSKSSNKICCPKRIKLFCGAEKIKWNALLCAAERTKGNDLLCTDERMKRNALSVAAERMKWNAVKWFVVCSWAKAENRSLACSGLISCLAASPANGAKRICVGWSGLNCYLASQRMERKRISVVASNKKVIGE